MNLITILIYEREDLLPCPNKEEILVSNLIKPCNQIIQGKERAQYPGS